MVRPRLFTVRLAEGEIRGGGRPQKPRLEGLHNHAHSRGAAPGRFLTMKRDLAEYSSDLDWSSPPPETESNSLLPADKRARSEEINVSGCSRYTCALPGATPTFAPAGVQTENLTRVIDPQGRSHLLDSEQLHPSKLSKDPTFYEYSTFHFDFTSPALARKHFEQWAASLRDDLARHVKRLKFTVVGPPGAPLEIPRDVEFLVQRGALTWNEPDAVLRKKLARADEQCVGAGFGVNGLIAIGRAMV